MVSFIDEHRGEHGVEPICKQLPIAPSTYYAHKSLEREPDRACDRDKRDQWLEVEIQRIWDANQQVYGVRKVWRQLARESIEAARCTVARLMKRLGIEGVRRGRKCWITISDDALDRPADLVNRQFVATRPNQLWVADITFGAPSLRKLLWKMLSGLEHVWNASRTTLEETNWMPALCYGRA
jgi:putative transposase